MSNLVMLIARICLSVIFILSGFGKLVAVSGVSSMLAKHGFPQPMLFGYAVGLLEVFGGIMVLVGFATRWAALVLAAFTLGTIFLAHNFWAVDGAQYMAQRTQALKNLAIVGGFLMLFACGPGRFSADGR
ncbi:MAG: DoxX family protein [Variibacter sp.]